MGTLRSADGREVVLKGRTLVGRSSKADLQLRGGCSSHEHAVVYWAGTGWCLKDLGSRNRTRIKRPPSEEGRILWSEEWRLLVGDQLVFGDPEESWCFSSAAPPQPAAIRADHSVIRGRGSLLLLPDDLAPQASISPGKDGGWELERHGELRSVKDDERIEIGGQSFRLELPELDAPSALTQAGFYCISDTRLILEVSADEEHVSLTFENGSGRKKLSDYTFCYILVLLARARLEESRRGVPDHEAGWTYSQQLAKDLSIDAERLNTQVNRIRAAVAGLELVQDPREIIERRRTTTQLRIGVPRLEFR